MPDSDIQVEQVVIRRPILDLSILTYHVLQALAICDWCLLFIYHNWPALPIPAHHLSFPWFAYLCFL